MVAIVAKLDDWGKPAWIGAMILGFIVFWPIGLAILFYMIWSGRMGCGYSGAWGESRAERWERKMQRMQEKMARWQQFRERAFGSGAGFASSGNRAFDEYRTETIRRLEDEAKEFRDFLDRLRHARDKAEFDQFMTDRRNRPASPEEPRGDDEPPRNG
jgi:hypothetical protein